MASDGTKPLPEPMLIYYQGILWHSPETNITWRGQRGSYILSVTCSKITHLPGANDLLVRWWYQHQAIDWTKAELDLE